MFACIPDRVIYLLRNILKNNNFLENIRKRQQSEFSIYSASTKTVEANTLVKLLFFKLKSSLVKLRVLLIIKILNGTRVGVLLLIQIHIIIVSFMNFFKL